MLTFGYGNFNEDILYLGHQKVRIPTKVFFEVAKMLRKSLPNRSVALHVLTKGRLRKREDFAMSNFRRDIHHIILERMTNDIIKLVSIYIERTSENLAFFSFLSLCFIIIIFLLFFL